MASEEIQEKVTTYIRTHYMVAPDDSKFTPDAALFDSGYIDSFGVNDLIAYLESEFKLKVEDKDISQGSLDSINNMVAMVERKRS